MTQSLFFTRGNTALRDRCFDVVTADRIDNIESTKIRLQHRNISLMGLLKFALGKWR